MNDIFAIDIPDLKIAEEPDYSKNLNKDTREIKKGLRIDQDTSGTTVVAVAYDSQAYENNKLLEISAQSGEPLNYEAYDIVRDAYHVEGVAYYEIGPIPVNYILRMEGTHWEENIPLPYSVIRKYMSEPQKKLFDEWRSRYKSNRYEIIYLQTLGIF